MTQENPTALPLLSLTKGMLAVLVYYEFNGMFSNQIFQNKGCNLQRAHVSLEGSPCSCCKWPEVSQENEDIHWRAVKPGAGAFCLLILH